MHGRSNLLRRATAGTRTLARPQQQAVLPIQRHRMITPKGTSASELKASQAQIWAKEKLYPGFSQWRWLHCMAKCGTKGCDVI